MSMVAVLISEDVFARGAKFYELSARGPLVEYLRKKVGDLTVSEYFDDVSPGHYRGLVQCQDVQRLTYSDQSFDVCTSTEVFEHIPDDVTGFRNIRRVLKPGGVFIFTVPFSDVPETVERAQLTDEGIKYILPALYHGDAIRGSKGVLVFRDYGRDLLDRLLLAGFSSSKIIKSEIHPFLCFGSYVIVARA